MIYISMLSGNLHKMIWNIGIQNHMNELRYMFKYYNRSVETKILTKFK